MTDRVRLVVTLAVALGATLAATATWAAPTHPIADARKSVEIGQHFAIEGVVVDIVDKRFFTLRDDTGEMIVAIPDYITRAHGMPVKHERVRVQGKFDRKKLDHSIEGMRVYSLRRLGTATGGRGNPEPEATEIVPQPVPAAAMEGKPSGVESRQPMLQKELRDRMRAHARAYDTARKQAEAASLRYARAATAAGPEGRIDPKVIAEMEAADARVREIQSGVPALADEARKAGLEESAVQLYEKGLGLRR